MCDSFSCHTGSHISTSGNGTDGTECRHMNGTECRHMSQSDREKEKKHRTRENSKARETFEACCMKTYLRTPVS